MDAVTAQVLVMGFVVAVAVGAVMHRTDFCTLGAVSDLILMGHSGRLRAWLWAGAVATAGVAGLEAAGVLAMDLSGNPDTGQPPYRAPVIEWPRHLVGGLLFGIGMTLASGCASKNLVRLGGGNLKALVALAVMGVTAYAMLYSAWDHHLFHRWVQPANLDLRAWGIQSQSLADLAAAFAGPIAGTATAAIIALAIAAYALASDHFRTNRKLLVSGSAVGAGVVAAWWITAGPMGQQWVDAVQPYNNPPDGVGVQGLSFVAPLGETLRYLTDPTNVDLITFAMAAAIGLAAGALIHAITTRRLRIESFRDRHDLTRHIAGGVLMGIGGVLAMGCTIGQGITGISALAIGALISLGAIILGTAAALKFELYRLCYPDAHLATILMTTLADLRLAPRRWRRLERI